MNKRFTKYRWKLSIQRESLQNAETRHHWIQARRRIRVAGLLACWLAHSGRRPSSAIRIATPACLFLNNHEAFPMTWRRNSEIALWVWCRIPFSRLSLTSHRPCFCIHCWILSLLQLKREIHDDSLANLWAGEEVDKDCTWKKLKGKEGCGAGVILSGLTGNFSGRERESGRAMATTSSQLLCTSFLGQAALPMRSGFAGVNSGRSTCRVTCACSLSSAVRESLKMAVIIPVAAFTVFTASPQGCGSSPLDWRDRARGFILLFEGLLLSIFV